MSKAETVLHEKIMQWVARTDRGRLAKHHGSRWGDSGHPDLYGVIDGFPVFVEVKNPDGEEPEPLQYRQLEKWAAAGAVTGVARSVVDLIHILDDCSRGKRTQAEEWRHLRLLRQDSGRVGQDSNEDNPKGSN